MSAKAFYFLRQNGRSPIEEYLQTVKDLRQLAEIKALIDTLIESNGRLAMPYAKKIAGKIWELRARRGNRVFYVIHDGANIILLDGHTKKRDRLESRVLRRVQRLYEEYLLTGNQKQYS